jgi:hypothetical protein
VHPKAVEGLLEERIFAESRFTTEAFTAIGTSKEASRQGQRVHQREGRIVRGMGEQLLPEVFLDLPEVCGLPREGGAMHRPEGREPFAVVPSEEEVDALVGVYSKELAYDLYGEDLSVGKLRSWTALADALSFEPVVYEAEDANDEGAKIHKKKTSVMFGAIGLTPSVGRSSLWLKSSREKLAHGVS